MNITGRNINNVYIDGLWWLKTAGKMEDSRGGRVLVAPGPVMSTYTRPWERILLSPVRDANPFFHLAEAIWMLAGSREVAWLSQFNATIAQFSDNGETFHGAYGHRWRFHHKVDQIRLAISMLRDNPADRQVVLGIWDPAHDLCVKTNDVPCNTTIYFRTRAGELEMTVCCRSNDAVWGAYGANVVHFSFLHELLARSAGLPQGRYHQLSNSLHIYERHWPLMRAVPTALEANPYDDPYNAPLPLFTEKDDAYQLLADCWGLVNQNDPPTVPLLKNVVVPLLEYYVARKEDINLPLPEIPECDWKTACYEWIKRRIK